MKIAQRFMLTAVCVGSLTIIPFAHAGVGDRSALFFDDFEQASFAKWETPTSPNWEVNFGSLAGTYGADVEGNTDGNDAIRRSVSTLGHNNIEISYRFKADNLENNSINNDAVRVQYSLDGGRNWVTIYSIADGEDDHIDGTNLGLYHKFHSLPEGAANNANFVIRFDPQLIGGPDEVWIDDVMISGVEMPVASTPPTPPVTQPVTPPAPVPAPAPAPLPTQNVTEQTYAVCNDTIDNDRDGTTDVFDIGCLDFRQTLGVVTRVVGGTLTPPDFDFDVTLGTQIFASGLRGSITGTQITRPESGNWKVVAHQKPGYTHTLSGDCDVSGFLTMGFNMYKTCTITHTFSSGSQTPVPPTTLPLKETSYSECNDRVDNDNDGATDVFDIGCLNFRQTLKIVTEVRGGGLAPSDFSVRVRFNPSNESMVLTGKTLGEEVTSPITSTWQILPIEKVGYMATFGGDCSASGSVGMGFNFYKTCTVTWSPR